MAAIEKLIERSREFNNGLDLLKTARATFEKMKQSDKVRLDTDNEDLNAGILRFRFCGVQMYARLEIRSDVPVMRENGIERLKFVPVLVWGTMRKSPDGRYLESDHIETAYNEKVLLAHKEKGIFTMRGTEDQDLSRLLAEIVLSLATSDAGAERPL